jgi:hypothetical protein
MNYQNRVTIQANQAAVLTALTKGIPNWWTEDFSGVASKVGDAFTVRFGSTFKVFEVTGLGPNKVSWTCLDSFIDMPDLIQKDEWKDTRIHWTLTADGQQSQLEIVHEGLTPEVECFEICRQGWTSFVASLKRWLETGKGQPYKLSKEHLVKA